MAVWSVSTQGGAPKLLGGGDAPAISPDGKRVAFTNDGAVTIAPIDGSAAAKRMFFDRGQDSDLRWSPDGSSLAFVSTRDGDHSFIGIYRNDATPIQYLAPSTSQDVMPRWSPDGTRIAFIRVPGDGGPPQNPLNWNLSPWEIWVADAISGSGRRVWASPNTLRGSLPQTGGGPLLEWVAGDRLVFNSEQDNWPHLYGVSANGGAARLLTPGAFMVEDVSVAPDLRSVVYSANTGSTPGDDDRRHIYRVDVETGGVTPLASGASSEFGPGRARRGRRGFQPRHRAATAARYAARRRHATAARRHAAPRQFSLVATRDAARSLISRPPMGRSFTVSSSCRAAAASIPASSSCTAARRARCS